MKKLLTKSWNTITWLREFLQDAKDWQYIIQEYSPPRNVDQNALLHAYLTYIAKETWNDMLALKELMKKKFASKRKLVKIWWKKQYSVIVEQTSKMNRKRFAEFLNDVEMFFAPYGYPIPPRDSLEFQSLISNY